jgi:Arc/MetJ family transcription regulator
MTPAIRFSLAGCFMALKMDSMKTTINIPEKALSDAMRFTGAKTKREAVVKALEAFNRQQLVKEVVASFGTLDFASNDEIEAGDLEEIARREGKHQKHQSK